MKILLGTKNDKKIPEFLDILAGLPAVQWLTYQDCPFRDVEEDGRSFEENALKKARQISQETGLATLAEDSGLEVRALQGAPGVRSARFAGEKATDSQNIQKLLQGLKGVADRRARFVCVAVLRFPDGRELISRGMLEGKIAEEPRGQAGFGYDPVFIPEGYDKTLAELGPEVKNHISHRRRALEKLMQDLL